MAQISSSQNDPEKEKPSSATAVIPTLTAVTSPAPNRLVSRSDCRLDTIVPAAMIMVSRPA